MDEITVNGITYYRQRPDTKPEYRGEYKIVILQRGWVMIGKLERDGSECKLHNASVIRTWGTEKGLGEIAEGGPTPQTKLDRCNGLVEFDYLTVIATISVNENKWELKL